MAGRVISDGYSWREDRKDSVYTGLTGASANTGKPLTDAQVDLILDGMQLTGENRAELRRALKSSAGSALASRLLRQIPEGKRVELKNLDLGTGGQVMSDNPNIIELDNENLESYGKFDDVARRWAENPAEATDEQRNILENLRVQMAVSHAATTLHEAGHATEFTGVQDLTGREFYCCRDNQTGELLPSYVRTDAQTGKTTRYFMGKDTDGTEFPFTLENGPDGKPRPVVTNPRTGTSRVVPYDIAVEPLTTSPTADMNLSQAVGAAKMIEIEKAAQDDIIASEVHTANHTIGVPDDVRQPGSKEGYANPYIQLKLLQNKEELERSGKYANNPEGLQLAAQQQTMVQIMADYARSPDETISRHMANGENEAWGSPDSVCRDLANLGRNSERREELYELYQDMYVNNPSAASDPDGTYRQFLEDPRVQKLGREMHAHEVLNWAGSYVGQTAAIVGSTELEDPNGAGNPERHEAIRGAYLDKYGPGIKGVLDDAENLNNNRIPEAMSSYKGTPSHTSTQYWQQMREQYQDKEPVQQPELARRVTRGPVLTQEERDAFTDSRSGAEKLGERRLARRNWRKLHRDARATEEAVATGNTAAPTAEPVQETPVTDAPEQTASETSEQPNGTIARLNAAQERKGDTGEVRAPTQQAEYS